MNKLLLILSCIIAVIADMLFVWYAKKESHPVLAMIIALICSNISIWVWSYTMRHGIESPMAITTYCLLTMTGCTMLGCFVFNEHLSMINWIGIGLSFIALLLISF